MANVLTRFKSLISFNPDTCMLQKQIPNVPPSKSLQHDRGQWAHPGFLLPGLSVALLSPPGNKAPAENNEASEEAMISSVYVSSHTHCVCIHIHTSLFFLVPVPRAMR